MKTTIRRGMVRFWNVFAQAWAHAGAALLMSDSRLMATLPERDRARVRRAAKQYPTAGL